MPEIDIAGPIPQLDEKTADFIRAAPLPALNAAPVDVKLQASVETILSSRSDADPKLAAALWILIGELDRSHTASQSDASAEGSFWHGIMHRREGDYGNAKYWFRRVGSHPVHAALANMVEDRQAELAANGLPIARLTDSARLAESLVDVTEEAVATRTTWSRDLQRVCWWEWQLLFAECSRINQL